MVFAVNNHLDPMLGGMLLADGSGLARKSRGGSAGIGIRRKSGDVIRQVPEVGVVEAGTAADKQKCFQELEGAEHGLRVLVGDDAVVGADAEYDRLGIPVMAVEVEDGLAVAPDDALDLGFLQPGDGVQMGDSLDEMIVVGRGQWDAQGHEGLDDARRLGLQWLQGLAQPLAVIPAGGAPRRLEIFSAAASISMRSPVAIWCGPARPSQAEASGRRSSHRTSPRRRAAPARGSASRRRSRPWPPQPRRWPRLRRRWMDRLRSSMGGMAVLLGPVAALTGIAPMGENDSDRLGSRTDTEANDPGKRHYSRSHRGRNGLRGYRREGLEEQGQESVIGAVRNDLDPLFRRMDLAPGDRPPHRCRGGSGGIAIPGGVRAGGGSKLPKCVLWSPAAIPMKRKLWLYAMAPMRSCDALVVHGPVSSPDPEDQRLRLRDSGHRGGGSRGDRP